MTSSRGLSLLVLTLFLGAAWLYSRQIHFPFYYHADEPVKVRQIIQDERNFHHPLLMLNAVAAAVKFTGTPLRAQPVVEAGRWFSIVMSAMAVALLAIFAARIRGLGVAAASGMLLFLHEDVFELAHYFKEDPALLCGTVLTFVALAVLASRGGWLPALAVGAAAGLAFSAKYVGVVFLPLALGFAWWRGGWRSALVCVAGFVVVAALVNARMISHVEAARQSLKRETELVAHGQTQVEKKVPHAEFIQRFLHRVKPPLGLFYAWGLWVWWRRRKDGSMSSPFLSAVESAMILFPFAFTLMLSFSAKDSGRYFHPSLAGICYTAGLGLADVVARLWQGGLLAARPPWLRRALAVCAVLAALIGSGRSLAGNWRGFENDARSRMMNFIRAHVPADAVVLAGRKVNLPDARNPLVLERDDLPRLPQDLRFTSFIADAGSLAALKKQGVSHLVLSEDEYGRYIKAGARAKESGREEFEKRRAFYLDLFARGTVLLEIPPGTIGTHNPPLKLIQLP